MRPPQRCSLAEPRRHRERAAGGSLRLSRGNVAHTVDDDVASTARDPRALLEIVHEALVPVELLRADEGPGLGKTSEEVRAEGTPEAIVSARVFTGNRPTTSIMAPSLTPSVLGQLIALYEHITFVEGAVWGIDSFDQWGVELGKKLALQIAPAVSGDAEALASQDASTQALIKAYRELRH